MTRIDKVLANDEYKKNMSIIELAERTRKFCLHGLSHSLDVARISYIIDIEENLGFHRDVIYAMALLHDIGRGLEYETGKPHHEAGTDIARLILTESGFADEEIELICNAISCHKNPGESSKNLNYILFKADKLSRNCFNCCAYNECYWNEDLKNKTITY